MNFGGIKYMTKHSVKAKDALTETPVLAYYDPRCPTSLHTDASHLKGIGICAKAVTKRWNMENDTCRLTISNWN